VGAADAAAAGGDDDDYLREAYDSDQVAALVAAVADAKDTAAADARSPGSPGAARPSLRAAARQYALSPLSARGGGEESVASQAPPPKAPAAAAAAPTTTPLAQAPGGRVPFAKWNLEDVPDARYVATDMLSDTLAEQIALDPVTDVSVIEYVCDCVRRVTRAHVQARLDGAADDSKHAPAPHSNELRVAVPRDVAVSAAVRAVLAARGYAYDDAARTVTWPALPRVYVRSSDVVHRDDADADLHVE